MAHEATFRRVIGIAAHARYGQLPASEIRSRVDSTLRRVQRQRAQRKQRDARSVAQLVRAGEHSRLHVTQSHARYPALGRGIRLIAGACDVLCARFCCPKCRYSDAWASCCEQSSLFLALLLLLLRDRRYMWSVVVLSRPRNSGRRLLSLCKSRL